MPYTLYCYVYCHRMPLSRSFFKGEKAVMRQSRPRCTGGHTAAQQNSLNSGVRSSRECKSYVLPVIGNLIDPVKSAAVQKERFGVQFAQLCLDLLPVHLAVQGDKPGRGRFQSEIGFPCLVSALAELHGLGGKINFSAVALHGAVGGRYAHTVEAVKGQATPARFVSKERWAQLAIHGKLIDGVNPIQGRRGGKLLEALFYLVKIVPCGVHQENQLHPQHAEVEPAPVEEWLRIDRRNFTIQDEHIQEAAGFRQEQETAHTQQVKRVELYRNVITHVEDEHVAHGPDCKQTAQGRQPRNKEQRPGDHFYRSGKNRIGCGIAHEGPEQ